MRKSHRCRPQLESLESMMLLSTLTVAAHKAPMDVAVAPPDIFGTINASGRLSRSNLSASGSTSHLGNLGPVSFKYSTNVNNPSSRVTLSTRHGNLILVSDTPLTQVANTGSTHYHIVQGTRSYVGATGSGDASVSLRSLKGNRATITVTFTNFSTLS